MKRRDKIIYWIATIWLAWGMISTAMVQIFKMQVKVDFTNHLGYPPYFITILGVWKILGVIALLIPKFALLKEWAYAGFFFAMSGAIISHVATNTVNLIAPSLLLLVLTVVSWYFRPPDRKVILANQ